jgi:hypothetical protein
LFATVVTISWNIVGLLFQTPEDAINDIFRGSKFGDISRYSSFADVPYLVYYDEFYSGESYNRTELPDFKGFPEKRGVSIFDSEAKIVSILLVLLVSQIGFFILMFVNFSVVYRDERRDKVSVKNL